MGNESSRPKLEPVYLKHFERDFDKDKEIKDLDTTLSHYNLRPEFRTEEIIPNPNPYLRRNFKPDPYDRERGVLELPLKIDSTRDMKSEDDTFYGPPLVQVDQVTGTYFHSLVYELEMELEYLSNTLLFSEKKDNPRYKNFDPKIRVSKEYEKCRKCFKSFLNEPGVYQLLEIALKRDELKNFIPYYISFIEQFTNKCKSVCLYEVFRPFHRIVMKFLDVEDNLSKLDRYYNSIQTEIPSLEDVDLEVEVEDDKDLVKSRKITKRSRSIQGTIQVRKALLTIILLLCFMMTGDLTVMETLIGVRKTKTAVYESREKGDSRPILKQLEYVKEKMDEEVRMLPEPLYTNNSDSQPKRDNKLDTKNSLVTYDSEPNWMFNKPFDKPAERDNLSEMNDMRRSILPLHYKSMYDGLNVTNLKDSGMELVDSESYRSPEGSNPLIQNNSETWRSKDGTRQVAKHQSTYIHSGPTWKDPLQDFYLKYILI